VTTGVNTFCWAAASGTAQGKSTAQTTAGIAADQRRRMEGARFIDGALYCPIFASLARREAAFHAAGQSSCDSK